MVQVGLTLTPKTRFVLLLEQLPLWGIDLARLGLFKCYVCRRKGVTGGFFWFSCDWSPDSPSARLLVLVRGFWLFVKNRST